MLASQFGSTLISSHDLAGGHGVTEVQSLPLLIKQAPAIIPKPMCTGGWFGEHSLRRSPPKLRKDAALISAVSKTYPILVDFALLRAIVGHDNLGYAVNKPLPHICEAPLSHLEGLERYEMSCGTWGWFTCLVPSVSYAWSGLPRSDTPRVFRDPLY